MSAAAIVVAAGRGLRAGDGVPKQYRLLAGQPVLARTLLPFLAHPGLETVVAVIRPDDLFLYGAATATIGAGWEGKLLPPVFGGETRQGSVLAGLEALVSKGPEVVLVHDAARPFVGPDLIDRAVAEARRTGAAVPGLPVTDTIKVVGEGGLVVGTMDRGRLSAVQTPQGFRFDVLIEAHRRAAAEGEDRFTDDGALAEWAEIAVTVFDGDPENTKLTRPEDFADAERRLGGFSMGYVTRLGMGIDIHAFKDGDHVWLGGLRIPHDRGVAAHSDGDVILHALTDALLGALADGDIGVHFPPSDPEWRGAASDRFLAHAAGKVRARGGRIDHLDVTLLCEAPRLGPHRNAMRRRIAEIVGIEVDQVSLKATTTEKLGFTGRGEGLAAQAAATIRLPEARP
jgi:2-C-methyl-D-erythritol 4-phosphate cytidylyltransferase/2-C-methyl-D-erythritol 2,4-cyclodiphosphate synthase